MKKLSKKEQKEVDGILDMVGKTLIKTMNFLEAPNFITCTYEVEGDFNYHLKLEKTKKS